MTFSVAGDTSDQARSTAWLVVLLAVAGLLRVVGLNTTLWHDELAMLVNLIGRPFGDLVRSFPSDNNHPLYTILAWLSVRIFGEHAWALRLPAVSFGVASIWALYLVATRVTGRREALLACTALTFSYHHVWFSQNARGYTGLLFFTLLSSYWFMRSIREGTRKAWLAHGTTLALGTYVHLTAVYVGAAQFLVYVGYLVNRDPELRRGRAGIAAGYGFVLAGLLALALHAPILPQLVYFFFLREGRIAVQAEWTNPLWTLLEAARSLGVGLPLGLAALGLGLLILFVGVVSYWRRALIIVWLFVLPAALGAGTMLALGRNLWPRFFFFLAGFGVMIGVRAVTSLTDAVARAFRLAEPRTGQILATATVGAFVALSSVMLQRNYALPKQDYVGAMDFVMARRKPGEPVMTTGLATFPYKDYYRTDFLPIESVADLDARIARTQGYVVYTFPIHLRSRYPALWAALRARGQEIARFPGTVGDGDLVVLQVRP